MFNGCSQPWTCSLRGRRADPPSLWHTRPTVHTHRGKQPIGGLRKCKSTWQHGQLEVLARHIRAHVSHRRRCRPLVLEETRHRQSHRPLTTESDRIAATPSGNEASWLRSPAPDISNDLKGHTTVLLSQTSRIQVTSRTTIKMFHARQRFAGGSSRRLR